MPSASLRVAHSLQGQGAILQMGVKSPPPTSWTRLGPWFCLSPQTNLSLVYSHGQLATGRSEGPGPEYPGEGAHVILP